MTQPPSGDPPPESERPPVDPPATEPPTTEPTAPQGGIISAEPVGWAGSVPGSGAGPTPDAPLVGWASPAPPPAPVTEGLVIAGVFARLVAYSVDLVLLFCLNIAVNGILGFDATGRDDTIAIVVGGVLIGVEFLYFVGLWTSGWQGTLGMRLLKLRVLGAATAGTLPANDALLRWLALSGAVSILALVPGIGPYIGLVGVLWILALLASTSTNRLHQGLHDRWARSVVVQPAPGSSGPAVITCLILVVLFAVVLPLVFLAIAGDQIQEILSAVGDSI